MINKKMMVILGGLFLLSSCMCYKDVPCIGCLETPGKVTGYKNVGGGQMQYGTWECPRCEGTGIDNYAELRRKANEMGVPLVPCE